MRNGSQVYTYLMDMTKAFNMVRHSLLFKKLIAAGLSIIFVRLLLYIYVNQFDNVRGNGNFSSIFSIANGIRQGAILSGFSTAFTQIICSEHSEEEELDVGLTEATRESLVTQMIISW